MNTSIHTILILIAAIYCTGCEHQQHTWLMPTPASFQETEKPESKSEGVKPQSWSSIWPVKILPQEDSKQQTDEAPTKVVQPEQEDQQEQEQKTLDCPDGKCPIPGTQVPTNPQVHSQPRQVLPAQTINGYPTRQWVYPQHYPLQQYRPIQSQPLPRYQAPIVCPPGDP